MGIRNIEVLSDPDGLFPYRMRAYYADDVKPPKVPGALAIETQHKTEASLNIEVAAARSRSDIGRINTWDS